MTQTDELNWIREKLEKLDPAADDFADGLGRLSRRAATRLRDSGGVPAACRLASTLWEGGILKERLMAVHLLHRFGASLPQSTWHVFRRWIEETSDSRLQDEVGEWLIGSLVTQDRAWLRVLRHWTEMEKGPLRRAGVLGALLRARTMSDVDAALMIAEPLMRVRENDIQEAVRRLLDEARRLNEPLVSEFMERWSGRPSSWALPAVRPDGKRKE